MVRTENGSKLQIRAADGRIAEKGLPLTGNIRKTDEEDNELDKW
jgi:hypothetical protein